MQPGSSSRIVSDRGKEGRFGREFLAVRARDVDLGSFVEGSQPLRVTVQLGDDVRVNAVRVVRTGRKLRY